MRTAEPRRAEQLGQPVGGEERDPGDAVAALGDASERAAAQQAPRRHADVVGRDDDGDRRERVAALGGDDGVVQRPGRGSP